MYSSMVKSKLQFGVEIGWWVKLLATSISERNHDSRVTLFATSHYFALVVLARALCSLFSAWR